MSTTLEKAVRDFLAQKRIAVAGVSRRSSEAANAIYKKLRGAGYQVFATNPKAEEVEGDPCYPDLASIPGGVDGVVVATPPAAAEEIVRQCRELGIPRVWMHRSFGEGSVSQPAVDYCRENGIAVIPGACPMMFCEPVDFGHKCIRFLLRMSGGMPAPG
jgi:predicted CoA-binding protein